MCLSYHPPPPIACGAGTCRVLHAALQYPPTGPYGQRRPGLPSRLCPLRDFQQVVFSLRACFPIAQ